METKREHWHAARHWLAAAFVLGLGLTIPMRPGLTAGPPPDRVAVVQIGADHTWALAIAPDWTWFVAGTQSAIAVRDLKTGTILREFLADAEDWFTRIAISHDGRSVVARLARDGNEVATIGWSAQTGARIDDTADIAGSLGPGDWSWVVHKWPSSWPHPTGRYERTDEKAYLIAQKLATLVDVEKVEGIDATERPDIIQVTTSGEAKDAFDPMDPLAEPAFSYHVYFIDMNRKTIVADVSGKTLRTFCGRPHGAFAFDGHHLLLAPTELDASSASIDAMLVDLDAAPPAVRWASPCRNYQVSGIEFSRGLIVVSETPDQATLWDPATARRVIHIDDIFGSDLLTWSDDRTTFAVGYDYQRAVDEPRAFGVEIIRANKRQLLVTEAEVLEIRLGADGSKVFARTKDGWSAWDSANGARLSSFSVPAAPEDSVREARADDPARAQVYVRSLRTFDPCPDLRAAAFLSLKLCDVASKHALWLATAGETAYGREFLIMRFEDGRVLASDGADDFIKLVKEFDAQPFAR